jgi:hypothetical protein
MSSHGAVVVVASLKIDGENPIAASVGITRTHHFNAIPAALSLDGDLISVFISPTVARPNVSVEEPVDGNRDISKRRTESLALAILNVALPYFAGNDFDPMYGIGWISTAHDCIANRRIRLGQTALNGVQLRCRGQRNEHKCSGGECPKLHAAHSSGMTTDNSVDDHAIAGALMLSPLGQA